jgi:hypothetical protein
MSYLFIKICFKEKSLYYFHKKPHLGGFFGWVFYCQPWLKERNPWTLPKSLQPPRRELEEMEEVEEDPDEGKDSRRESPGSRESPGGEL